MSEYVKTQCRSLAAQTFREVVVNKFALYLDQRLLVLEDIPTYYISRTHNFITDKNSGEYFVSLNSLQFQTGKAELLDSNKVGYFYDGVPYGDDGTSFSVDLYRFEMDANGTCYSVAKTGLLKAEYTTIKDEKSVTKKLHFTVLPKEIKDLSDADVSYKIEKKTSTYTY